MSGNFATGDKLYIPRGKHRGQTGEVISVDEVNDSYAVKLENGSLAIINAVNANVPGAQGSNPISVKKLVDAVKSLFDSIEFTDEDKTATLAVFEKHVPGFTTRYNKPASEAAVPAGGDAPAEGQAESGQESVSLHN